MAHDLGRALLLAEAVTPDAVAHAMLASVQSGVSLVRALLTTGAISMDRLDEELARFAPDAPLQKHPVPVFDLVDRLPPRLCDSLVAIPVRRDPRTGTVDVALAYANDAHAVEEIGFFLGAPVRAVRSPLLAIELALARVRSVEKMRALATSRPEPARPTAHTPIWGTPAMRIDEPRRGATHVSERPVPLVDRGGSEPAPIIGLGGDADHGDLLDAGADIPILLSRRVVSGDIGPLEDDGMVMALTRAKPPRESRRAPPSADEDDGDDLVVELRRSKTPSRPSALAPPDPPPSFDGAATIPTTPLHQILKEMARLTSRDPLMELVLIAVRSVAHKAALFAVKKDAFVGWMCTSEFGDRGALAEVKIPAMVPSFLATAAASGHYVGPLLRSAGHEPFGRFIKSPRPEVIAVAIKAAMRPAVILVAHEVGDQVKAMTVLDEVARAAGESLEKILRGQQSRNGVPSRR